MKVSRNHLAAMIILCECDALSSLRGRGKDVGMSSIRQPLPMSSVSDRDNDIAAESTATHPDHSKSWEEIRFSVLWDSEAQSNNDLIDRAQRAYYERRTDRSK